METNVIDTKHGWNWHTGTREYLKAHVDYRTPPQHKIQGDKNNRR